MEQKSGGSLRKVKRGKVDDITQYELLLRNSHELLWRKLSEYTIIHLGIVRVKIWFPELKLASNIKLDRCSSVDSAISYIARKKKITSPHCGLFLERHGESGVWLENNTPMWLYDIQASDVLEYKPRPAYSSTVVAIRVFIVEQKIFKSTVFDKVLKVAELVALFQVQFGLVKDSSYYGFNLLTPEANEIWLADECPLSAYLVHNMSVVEYKKKPVVVLEPIQPRLSVAKNLVLQQSVSVVEATTSIGRWLSTSTEGCGLFYMQQNTWLESDSHVGVFPFKPNDVIAIGPSTESAESLLQRKDACARVIFAAPPGKNFAKPLKVPSLPGEVPMFKVSNVLHLSNFTSPSPASVSGGVVGDITISNYRLTFCALQSPEILVEIPVAAVARTEKKGKNKTEIFNGYFLDILCKDNRLIRFYWPHHDESRKKLNNILRDMAFPNDPLKLFAFFYKDDFSFDGWSILNFEAEYQRQQMSRKLWRISHINANFQMCDSYPPLLAVPAKITDDQLRTVFEFRSKGRIPVMTWQHPFNGTSISRCSQPLSGIRMTRCPEDEALIRSMGFANQPLIVDKLEKDLFVLDCRPKVNAMGNRAKGAGYEDTTTSYPNCILEFLDIGNIHVMRESHEKLLEAILQAIGGAPGGGWSGSGPSDWLSAVASTKWLDHIGVIFQATARVVDCIHNQEVSVLLHCSDGWDRTAQVASLSLLLLDPYHRTLHGFALLIEKEWLSFGHKFAQRHGFGDSKHLDERSPVFLQFLDCVWQMTQQFPYAFEFNETFLLAILTHLHSCRFGTFLFNSCSERMQHSIQEKTASLWSMLLSPPNVNDYMNLFYEPQDHVLIPNTSPRYFQLWHRAHLSWYMAVPPSADAKVRQYMQEQASTIDKLARQVEELKNQIDPSRVKHSESKPANQVDSKQVSSEHVKNMFAKNLRAAILSRRVPSGVTNQTPPQWDPTLPLNPQFSRSISSDFGNLNSSASSSLSSSSVLNGSASVELSHSSLLRGDSPFGGYSGYSSNEDNSDDDEDSSNITINENGSPNTHANQNQNAAFNGTMPGGRSPTIGSRSQLELPLSSSFSIPHQNAPYQRPPSPTVMSSSLPISPIPLNRTISTRNTSPATSSTFVAGKVAKMPQKTASSPHVSVNALTATSSLANSKTDTTTFTAPSFAITPPSPRTLRSAAALVKPIELAVIEDPAAPSPNNTNVASYIATVSNATVSPRGRGPGTAAFTNAAGVSNVANYINLNFSDKIVPRTSPSPPSATSPRSLPMPPSRPNTSNNPETPPSPRSAQNASQEENKWQQVRRTPSSRSLNFLDQSNRLVSPPTSSNSPNSNSSNSSNSLRVSSS